MKREKHRVASPKGIIAGNRRTDNSGSAGIAGDSDVATQGRVARSGWTRAWIIFLWVMIACDVALVVAFKILAPLGLHY